MPGPAAGVLVRAARLRLDLTLEALAARAGLTDRAISDIERGVRTAPRLHTLRALADALELTPAQREELFAAARAARAGRPDAGAAGIPLRRLPDFVGRAAELEGLRAMLAEGTAGAPVAVVLTGAPGTGKTTLASELMHGTPDGVDRLSVDLRGLDAIPLPAAGVLRQLLAQLPGTPEPAASSAALTEQWRTATAGRTVLVLLDNAATEAQVRPVLGFEGVGGVVITSRRRLAGLEGARHLTVGALPPADGVRLLAALVPHGRATDESLATLAELCDHVPLALRIAGSRLASNPGWEVEDFLGELRSEERRLRALVAGDLAVESAFGLSYQHVSAEARELFRVLSLMDDTTWSAQLPAAVLGETQAATAEGLDELVELGLVEQVAPARYRLHDLMRLFSRSKLRRELTPELIEALERRKRTWLIGAAMAAGSWFEPGRDSDPGAPGFGDQTEARAWLRLEVGGWLPALRSAAAAGEHRAVLDMADSLHWFSDLWPHAGIWHDVFRLSSAASEAIGDPREQAVHFGHLSWAETMERHDAEAAAAQALRSLESARSAADPTLEAWGWYYVAEARRAASRFEDVIEPAQRAAALFAETGDREGLPQALGAGSSAKMALGRLDDAEADLRRIVALVRSPDTAPAPNVARFTETVTLLRLSVVLLEQDRVEPSLQAAESAESVAASIGHEWCTAKALQLRGHALSRTADPERAAEPLRAAVVRFTAIGSLDDAEATTALLDGLEGISEDERPS